MAGGLYSLLAGKLDELLLDAVARVLVRDALVHEDERREALDAETVRQTTLLGGVNLGDSEFASVLLGELRPRGLEVGAVSAPLWG